MKTISVTLLLVTLFASKAPAQEETARWIRACAISPDAKRIAFTYRGDLWVVPVEGGRARPLTSHVGHDTQPVWTRDSGQVVFASDRHGNFDLFVVSAEGGRARRLTYHSADDQPCCIGPEGKQVWFVSRRLDAPQASVASTFLPELYAIPLEGGRPVQLLTTATERGQLSPDGKQFAYQDLKGYENRWRKHHVSSVARDIRIWDRTTGVHRRLTEWRGEDRDPVWAPGGGAIHYLSERGGSFNVWTRPSDGSGEAVQRTRHGPHPVRFLSSSVNGTLAYSCNGQLFVLVPGVAPRALEVSVGASDRVNPERFETLRSGATGFALSPSEEEIALVVRGEIFAASVEHGTTRRITDTPTQERSVTFAPDGKALYYAAERNGSWGIYRTRLVREGETHFFRATALKEEPVLVDDAECFQPLLSPDGKRLAYLRNRDEIAVYDLAKKISWTVVPPERNYSYSDGDLSFAWSPDSKWLVFSMFGDGIWISDIGIAEVETGAITNLTRSGYDEERPSWSADGKAILFYSNRLGRRSHGGWGSEGDLFALYLTREAWDRAQLSEEEFELLDEGRDQEDERFTGGGRGRRGKRKPKQADRKPAKPVRIEFEGIENRFKRLTVLSSPVGGYAFAPKGESVVYFAQVEEKWDLWVIEPRKRETRRLASLGARRPGEVIFTQDGDAVFVRRGEGRIQRVPVGGGGGRGMFSRSGRGGEDSGGGGGKSVAYAAGMTIRPIEERAYIFDHAWRQVLRKFYDEKLHGVDWEALRRNYEPMLAQVENNHEFAELLSELLGELNASHTGARYRPESGDGDQTAALGLLYDVDHVGAGLKVAEVLERGPLDLADARVGPGAILTHIDGTELLPTVNPNALLNRRAGKPLLLAFRLPDGQQGHEVVVKPIDGRAEANLLYLRWRKQRRELVEKLSDGKVGYVHVRGMGDSSFRHLFQEVLGRHATKQALIVDTRFNGGGWLHDDLIQFLGGKAYGVFQPRGKRRGSIGGEPLGRWAKPVAVIQNEGNYSDAHVFPYAFKQLGIGKLVGTPVAGTGTAVWWERQIDPTLVFGIPQVGIVTPSGQYLENLELQPDIEVYNDPESVAQGRDLQLEKAVEVLLAEIAGR